MFIKKYLLTIRQYKTLLLEIIFPMFLIIAGISGGGGIDISDPLVIDLNNETMTRELVSFNDGGNRFKLENYDVSQFN